MSRVVAPDVFNLPSGTSAGVTVGHQHGAEAKDRPFGLWTAIAMVVGTMVGAGIFVLPGQFAKSGWNGAMAWGVAGLGAMAIGLVMADLVAHRPDQPSILALCGTVLGPAAGVMISWSYWVSIWVSNAVIATAASSYLAAFIPAVGRSPMRIALGGIVIIIALTLANLRGPSTAGRIQVVTTVLKLLPLATVLIVLALLAFKTPDAFERAPQAPLVLGGITTALPLALYALFGFEAAPLMTELVRNPARNVPLAVVGGLGITTLIYFTVCTGIVLTLPAGQLATSPMPMALFVDHFVGPGAAAALSLFAVVAGLGSLNGLILLQGEIPRSLVHGGQLPEWMAQTNRHDVAAMPLLLASGLTVILLLAGASRFGASVLDFLLRLASSTGIWLYFSACVLALVMGRSRILATIGVGFSAWLFYSTGLEAGAWGLVLMVVGLPLFPLARRTMARKSLSFEPVSTAGNPAI